MSLLLTRIALFALIPIGIYGAIWAYRLGKKIFSRKVLVNLPFNDRSTSFVLEESGYYSIWQKGEWMKRNPLGSFRPRVTNTETQKVVSLNMSLLRPSSNDVKTGSMEIFWFKADKGNYKLELVDGSSLSALESAFSSAFPLSEADLSKYFIQIRESMFPGASLIFILLCLVSFFFVLGGFVLGLLADQIFV